MSSNNKIYGLRPIIEALEAQQPINKVYLQKGLQGDLYRELEYLARKMSVSVSYVPPEKLNKFTKNNHQGAVADVSPVSFHEFEQLIEHILQKKTTPLFLLLDAVSDVRNFGAIIRTAECSGVDAIIIPKSGNAPINNDTVKTSAGAVFNIPITKVDHIKDALFYLKSSGISLIGANEKAEKLIYQVDLSKPLALVMGAEDKGISPSILKMMDNNAKLPMSGEVSSLNVSVACGAFLFEVVRQRLD